MDPIIVKHIETDFAISDLGSPHWHSASPANLNRYWSGEPAAQGRASLARFLWSETALYARFDASQDEPLIVNENPDTSVKKIGLWYRDVCEIFIATDRTNPNRYYEFEIAPTGEWLDLIVDWSKHEPRDWDYTSQLEAFAQVETGRVTMALRLPWDAFDRKPRAGDVWLGNLFRQVGSGASRGYLAWSPTNTPEPNFHVPEAFGEFRFVD